MSAAGSSSRAGALVRLGVATVAVAGLAGAATVFGGQAPDAARPTAEREPLTDTVLVCPHSVAGDDGEPSTTVQAMSAPLDIPRASGDGELQLRELADEDSDEDEQGEEQNEPRDTADEPGQTVNTSVQRSGVQPMLVQGTGSLAPGIGGLARTEAESGQHAGLAETRCDRPGSEFWFVGAGSEQGRHPRLYLTNIESTEARVTVSLWDSEGEVQTDQVRGVDIEAGGRLTVDLDDVAPMSSELAVQVTAQRGRVTAGLLDRTVEDGAGVGIDWLASSEKPRKSQLIPGVVPGGGPRELTVVAPGDSSATVELSLLGENGEFQPADPKQVDVPAGTVTSVNLADATGGTPTAVRLESDVPVTGSVRSVRENDSGRDFTYAASSRPFRSPAVIGSTAISGDREARLLLSNPASDPGTAEVRMFDDQGEEIDTQSVDMAPGATEMVGLPESEDGYTTVVEPPESGLVGSRILTDGAAVSSVGLHPAPLDALRPVVEPDPAAGLPAAGDRG